MIEISYYKAYSRFKATGHARSNEIGKDLVCAAVTTLVYTLAAAIDSFYINGAMRAKPKVRMESGEAEISWCPKSSMRRNVELATETVMGGFRLLAAQYPEYVKFDVLG